MVKAHITWLFTKPLYPETVTYLGYADFEYKEGQDPIQLWVRAFRKSNPNCTLKMMEIKLEFKR